MNNIYLSNIDPVLANSNISYNYQDSYIQPPQFIQSNSKDYISILDDKLKNLSEVERQELMQNNEFVLLNESFNKSVQQELLSLIKVKMNNNPNIIDNVNQQLDLISRISSNLKDRERQNLNVMNDYMTNYSHLTFAEYMKMKNTAEKVAVEKPVEEPIETDTKTKKFFK